MSFLILDGLLANDSEPSLIEHQSAFQRLAEVCNVYRVSIPGGAMREAMLLGFTPHEIAMSQGPLTVSALGFDPPDKSVHFHLSLMSIEGDSLKQVLIEPTKDELDVVKEEAKKLNTKLLTTLIGKGLDHALVWEKLGEFRTVAPSRLTDKPYTHQLPEGDGEKDLRRFIDDSINILSELDLNRRRVDHGQPPLNVFWPWGAGVRGRVPSLALRYGFPHQVSSDSLRLLGLARLSGLRQLAIRGKGTELRLNNLMNEDSGLTHTIAFQELRGQGKLEEADWLAHQIGEQVILPALDIAKENESKLTILALNACEGLVAQFMGKPADNMWPFDERTLHESKVARTDLDELCRSSLVG
jgi:hypothetical protein